MHGVCFVVGPTSSGKSAAALEAAERTGAEIVNADAFQLYRALELLTASPEAEARRRVPHHLFGCVDLAEVSNVARYREEAAACLEAIRQRGRPAIVVGGTGLYVKALTHGLSPLPPSDPVLRARLENTELPTLLAELARADPAALAAIDVQNKRRVVRALEVFLLTGTPFSSHREAWAHSSFGEGQAGVFLDRERGDLLARIDARVEAMFAAGVVDEVRAIDPCAVGQTAAGVIGLAEIRSLLAGKLNLAQCKDRVKTRTRQYAKRQVTWFKREPVFRRVCLGAADDPSASDVAELVASLISAAAQG